MSRQRRTAALVAGLFLGAVGYAAALQTGDAQPGDAAFRIAEAFESVPNENVTKLLDDVVVPASLESEKAVPETEPRDLRPIKVATTEHRTGDLPLSLPYGGALVAVEATALLVGGATIAVLAIAKIKSRATSIQYDYDKDHVDPMLQSLLYSDMDYAAI
ncbi:hypothetical protein F441_18881 [Phytophthora nicotianae CJ01A1]|uniref:RxLR effector protein n=5 Tax=Phytophthora nicotianae TaxID=4792 RepID=V9E838_PHYNI|nr:hypothetical protein F443_19073 [Phytophthora nicotianae P1569]ETK74766.1 hypothetical protein L915_18497 [Phytophthora nicotianae]ETO63208.1 hypothetical protein F444_19025 [Phytophthora nicotianae P1976]ETP04316.1 hypothetical protein F441_18881 [Phytophthora nicotianae CJ01A1]ETP32453.1 hypothetical protein F442_18854 [Phytophthora nicotianae P10297]KUF94642.1 hypothetical protein AM587_10012214 [Phytophthora nicotianae]